MPTTDRADVELRLPAEGAYVAVVRSTTAGLAARLDFTIDDIEDLKIVVGEAGALLLELAEPGSDLTVEFHLGEGRLDLALSATVVPGATIDRDGFAWLMLSTLAPDADARQDGTALRLTLAATSSLLDRA
ncbi:anti-sigma factor [Nocardioides sp.]|uniref:anti-sigma factor n=1 Tax=Nocardioides sp. TaxID=35761 RepID=UPI003511F8D2